MSNLKFYIWTPNLDHALFTIQTRRRFEKKGSQSSRIMPSLLMVTSTNPISMHPVDLESRFTT